MIGTFERQQCGYVWWCAVSPTSTPRSRRNATIAGFARSGGPMFQTRSAPRPAAIVGAPAATPAFHHWHHSRTDHIDHNYAATFPVLDRVFGSLYLPGHFPADYGITERLPATLTGQLLEPFDARSAAENA
jgi:sterol desaturase/sphingolipid hydroxylase (fatty acid hydroxylase superfamily)